MHPVDMDTTLYLDRMLDPVSRCLTPESARRLLDLKVDSELQRRIDDLAEKCTEGALTNKERAEYETYVRAGSLISILQLKARKFLATQDER
jgi:hypothetical protein